MTNSTTNDADRLAGLIDAELSRARVPGTIDAVRAYLVTPKLEMRSWDYSNNGEVGPVWIVADFRERDMGLAYSEFGHGRRGHCWGVVPLDADYFGRDDSWFLTLEDAFINSGMWKGPLPNDYEVL